MVNLICGILLASCILVLGALCRQNRKFAENLQKTCRENLQENENNYQNTLRRLIHLEEEEEE